MAILRQRCHPARRSHRPHRERQARGAPIGPPTPIRIPATNGTPSPHRHPRRRMPSQPNGLQAHCPPCFFGIVFSGVADPGAPRPPCTAVRAELDIEFGGRKQARRHCPRTRPPASAAAYLRLRPRPTQPTPRPLAQPTRAPIGCTTTARPPTVDRRLLRATQQRDIPQLR